MADERRKQPRFSIAGPIVVTSASDEAIEGQMADLSLLGFWFYSGVAFTEATMTELVKHAFGPETDHA